MSNHEDTNDPFETSLLQVDPLELDDEAKAYVQWMNAFEENHKKYYEPLGESVNKSIPSIEKVPQLEQKQLPEHLRYAYLGNSSTLPVIISTSLTEAQEEKLLRVLRDHKAAIGWSLVDLKGIRPAMCMHRILLEDGCYSWETGCPSPFGLQAKMGLASLAHIFSGHLLTSPVRPDAGCGLKRAKI